MALNYKQNIVNTAGVFIIQRLREKLSILYFKLSIVLFNNMAKSSSCKVKFMLYPKCTQYFTFLIN